MILYSSDSIRAKGQGLPVETAQLALKKLDFLRTSLNHSVQYWEHPKYGMKTGIPRQGELDRNSVGRLADTLKQVEYLKAAAAYDLVHGIAVKLPIALEARYRASDINGIIVLHDLQSPFLSLRFDAQGKEQGPALLSLAERLQTISSPLQQALQDAREHYHIAVEDKGNYLRITQPDLGINKELNRSGPDYNTEYSQAITKAVQTAQKIAEERFEMLVKLDEAGIPYHFAPLNGSCEPLSNPAASITESIPITLYGADIIPREIVETITARLAAKAQENDSSSSFSAEMRPLRNFTARRAAETHLAAQAQER